MPVPEQRNGAVEPPIIGTAKALQRRRATAAVTLVIGTGLLATTFRLPHGSGWFTPLTPLLLAITWVIGALLSGPIPVGTTGRSPWHTLAVAASIGLLAFGAFVAAHALGQRLPLVSGALDRC